MGAHRQVLQPDASPPPPQQSSEVATASDHSRPWAGRTAACEHQASCGRTPAEEAPRWCATPHGSQNDREAVKRTCQASNSDRPAGPKSISPSRVRKERPMVLPERRPNSMPARKVRPWPQAFDSTS